MLMTSEALAVAGLPTVPPSYQTTAVNFTSVSIIRSVAFAYEAVRRAKAQAVVSFTIGSEVGGAY